MIRSLVRLHSIVALISIAVPVSCAGEASGGNEGVPSQEDEPDEGKPIEVQEGGMIAIDTLALFLKGKEFWRQPTAARPGLVERFFSDGRWEGESVQIDISHEQGNWGVEGRDGHSYVCIDLARQTAAERFYGERDCRTVEIVNSGERVRFTDLNGRFSEIYTVREIEDGE